MTEPASFHSPDLLLAEAEAIAADPRFPQAVVAYAEGLVRFRESTRLLAKLSANETRLRVIGYLLHLGAVSRHSGGDGAVSYGQLRALTQAEISDRVLKTMLAILRLPGLVEIWRSPADRRVTLYRPTERLLDLARGMYSNSAAALDALAPQMRRLERLRSDPHFFTRLLVHAGEAHASDPPATRMPDFIAFFGAREGAGSIATRLVLADLAGPPVASRAALARQFGLSKTQVAEIVAEGVRLGHFTTDAQALPSATPLLHATLGQWISIELAFMARHMPA